MSHWSKKYTRTALTALARATLDLPKGWTFVAYLCLGWPEEEHDDPELERHGWEQRSCEAPVTPLKR